MESDAKALLVALEPRLREGLVSAYGIQVGTECAADAIAWGWEHRNLLVDLANPVGYLYRVGQSASRAYRRPAGLLPQPDPSRIPTVEPRLATALEQLTEPQRVAVLAVHAFGWTQQEVADLLGVSHSTVRTHIALGLERARVSR